MKQTGLIIGYDLRKPKKTKDKEHRTTERGQDRSALAIHLRSMGAMQIQHSLWYLKTPDSPKVLKGKLLRSTRQVTKKTKKRVKKLDIPWLIRRDRLAIFATNATGSVRIRPIDARIHKLGNLV